MNRYADGYYNDSYYEPEDDEDFDEEMDELDDADERVDEDDWDRDE
jgi:hypothetical protein